MRPRKTILCVEDNEQVLSVRKFLLETRGYRVVALSTGAEALEWLQEAAPGSVDLLLADLILPQMDGNELARRAKQLHPTLPTLQVRWATSTAQRLRMPSCRRARVHQQKCSIAFASWWRASADRRSRSRLRRMSRRSPQRLESGAQLTANS